jgi:hypothetical protein
VQMIESGPSYGTRNVHDEVAVAPLGVGAAISSVRVPRGKCRLSRRRRRLGLHAGRSSRMPKSNGGEPECRRH